MTYEYFRLLFIENLVFNLLVTFITITIVLLIYKKHIYSLFDPLLFFLILSSAGYSVVFVLFFSGNIDFYYVLHFLLTQAFFILGFLFFKPVNLKKIKPANNLCYLRITMRVKIIYYISAVLYIGINLFLYIVRGIPLFMTSKLDAMADGFGFVFSISLTVSLIILSILSYKFILGFKFNVFDYIIFLSYIIISLLSGARTIFIESIFVLFYVAYFISIKLANPKIMKRFNKIGIKLFLVTLVSLFTLLFFISDENPIMTIIFRIIMTGDVFMMAYVDNNIEILEGNFLNLILPYKLAGLLNLEHVLVVGRQLMTIVYLEDINSGPNNRHNILGYISFGYYGSLIFSLLLGMLVGFFRNKLIKIVKINLESLLVFILILSNVFILEMDLGLAIFKYISIFIIFTLIYSLSFIITYTKRS